MAKVTITRGWQGSGKSTAVRKRVDSEPNTVCVNRDLIRDELFGYRLLEPWQEDLVTLSETAQVEAFLKAGVNVIVDATHLKASYVKRWAKVAQKYGADFEIWDEFLNVPIEECIRRDAQRSGEARVGEDVIRAFFQRYGKVPKVDLSDLEAPKGEIYIPNPDLPKAYMVDIDGTCTTGPNNRSPYEWSKVGQDLPRQAVIDTVTALYMAGYTIIFCSGRDAVCRPETEQWLKGYFWKGVLVDNHLFMRSQGDMRKDNIVKLGLFDKYIRNEYNVIAVFDDRPQVIRMWNGIGLQVFDVAQAEEF